MSMFDRIRGLGKKKKADSSVSSTEDSFDLDDDALFGSGTGSDSDSDGGEFGTVDEFGGDEGMETFGTLTEDEGDLGAAGTADFEDFGDLGDSLGGESFGDDFGDAALDAAEPAADEGKKGKKKKAKRSKVAGRPGRGKVVGITVGAAVGALAVGFLVGPLLADTLTGKRKLEAGLADTTHKLEQAKQQLVPLERSASPEQIEALQAELATRQGHLQLIATVEAKVADLAEQEAGREHAIQRRDASTELLAVRAASLGNISKQDEQMRRRVAYLQARSTQLEQETAALDDHVRTLLADLPAAYTDAATAEATQTLNIQADLGAGTTASE